MMKEKRLMVQKSTTKVYHFISRKLSRRGLIQPRPGRSLRMLTLPFLWTIRVNRLVAIIISVSRMKIPKLSAKSNFLQDNQ